MTRRRTLADGSGISVLVSNVLMLMVVVAAASMTFFTVNLYVNDYQERLGAALMERLIIEDVWFKAGRLDVTVYNHGRIGAEVTTVFIDGVPVWEGCRVVEVRGHETITVNYFRWTPRRAYTIGLVTQRGAKFEAVCCAPQG